MNNVLDCDMPLYACLQHYGQIGPFKIGQEILTQLPKNVTIIRAAVTVAFTSLLALKLRATVFCWPVVIAGLAFTGWTIYSHLLSKDPLMEAFYKIAGGKDRFYALPEINLGQAPNEKICEAIERIDWDHLNHFIARTRTLDGRNVIIIKGLSRDSHPPRRTKMILAFIEKVGPKDLPIPTILNISELARSIIHAVLTPFEGNTFGTSLYFNVSNSSNQENIRHCRIYSSISSNLANELFIQLL